MNRQHMASAIGRLALFPLIWIIACPWAASLEFQPDPVAIVNGSGIALEDYERELVQIRKRARRQGRNINDAQLAVLKTAVLENLIGRELLFQESLKAGINAAQGDVDSQLAFVENSFPDIGTFAKVLSEAGLTPVSLARQIRRSMILQRFVDKRMGSKADVADRDIRVFYDRNQRQLVAPASIRASHILIKLASDASREERQDALSRIKAIRQKLSSGEDFAQLARLYSEGVSGADGGDLGYFSRGQMARAFDDAAFSLSPEEVSDVVETDYGFHLIRVADRQAESIPPFEEVADAIRQELEWRQIQKEVTLYIEKLKETADIKRYLR